MNIPLFGKIVDERFLNYRLKSSSVAGIVGALVAVAILEYRFFVNHVWSWDVLAIALTFVVVKMAMMARYMWIK